ncbi:MAG: VOC family protein [Acidimicrobiales bacterium]
MSEPRYPGRFNHVAMSMAPEALDAKNRADITAFYAEVFGWQEHPTMTEDRKRLVMGVQSYDQFVFLIAEDEPMKAPRLDHFGLSVDTLDELHEVIARAKAYAERDDRVDIIDYDVEDHGMIKLHNFYVGFLLPMMVEVQCFELVS